MDLVKIQLECDINTAEILLSLLVESRKRRQQNIDGWYCFFAGDRFKIGDIVFEVEDDKLLALLDDKIQNGECLWGGEGIFRYRLNDQDYIHIEQNVRFSDSSESNSSESE